MSKTNKIVNTTEDVTRNPLAALMTHGLPGQIEASEAQGQAQIVKSDVLPAEILPKFRRDRILALLAEWGVVLGEPVPGDPLFVYATLPSGWTRKKDDHAMWSSVVDDEGKERLSIFYKAAFYDRRAHLHVAAEYEKLVYGEAS